MAIFATIVTGFLTFVLGQIFVKLVVEPIGELKQHIGRIASSLIEYAATLSNLPVPDTGHAADVKTHLRELSGNLLAKTHLVPRYATFARFFGLPSREAVDSAAASLIGLSNMVYEDQKGASLESAYMQQEIRDALGIYTPPAQRVRRRAKQDSS